MRMYGYCERCRRFKQVAVKAWGRMGKSHMPSGVCRECEDKERERDTRTR